MSHLEWNMAFARQSESYRQHPYLCSASKLTIGYGRNIEDVGISKVEAEFLLRKDIRIARQNVSDLMPWLESSEPVRFAVLTDMCFNLGETKFLKFKKMLAAVKAKNYTLAAAEMVDSKWYRQVKSRAKTLEFMMRSGFLVESR